MSPVNCECDVLDSRVCIGRMKVRFLLERLNVVESLDRFTGVTGYFKSYLLVPPDPFRFHKLTMIDQ